MKLHVVLQFLISWHFFLRYEMLLLGKFFLGNDRKSVVCGKIAFIVNFRKYRAGRDVWANDKSMHVATSLTDGSYSSWLSSRTANERHRRTVKYRSWARIHQQATQGAHHDRYAKPHEYRLPGTSKLCCYRSSMANCMVLQSLLYLLQNKVNRT